MVNSFLCDTVAMIRYFFPLLFLSSIGFNDPEYSFQALRTLSGAVVGSADIAECLLTIDRIEEGEDESWYREWLALAERVEQQAETSKARGDLLSATQEYRRASNYYRSAEFFLHGNPKDPRILATWGKSRSCCRESIATAQLPVREVRIPFEKTTLPAYLSLVDETPRPLLIAQTGFDGTAEELYFHLADAARERGYHLLVFEGPGQGEVIRLQGIPFRPDWERVITPVVDYALSLKEVDPDRIALLGASLGGLLISKGLAFEGRVKVGISNCGPFDFHKLCMKGNIDEEDLDNPEKAAQIDLYIFQAMKSSPTLRWAIQQGMYTFKAATPSEWLKMTRPYTLAPDVDKIRTKMLVVDSEQDWQNQGQAEELYKQLIGPKTLLRFTKTEGAVHHCQVGAYSISNEQIFNWLQNNL